MESIGDAIAEDDGCRGALEGLPPQPHSLAGLTPRGSKETPKADPLQNRISAEKTRHPSLVSSLNSRVSRAMVGAKPSTLSS